MDVNISPQQNTIWLTQDQITKLFEKSRSTITEYINTIFSEGELFEMTSVGNSDITNHRPAKLYNLDVILAVGYRVKTKRENIEYGVIAISENDKYASRAYESLHGKVNNLGDIKKI